MIKLEDERETRSKSRGGRKVRFFKKPKLNLNDMYNLGDTNTVILKLSVKCHTPFKNLYLEVFEVTFFNIGGHGQNPSKGFLGAIS